MAEGGAMTVSRHRELQGATTLGLFVKGHLWASETSKTTCVVTGALSADTAGDRLPSPLDRQEGGCSAEIRIDDTGFCRYSMRVRNVI